MRFERESRGHSFCDTVIDGSLDNVVAAALTVDYDKIVGSNGERLFRSG